MPRTSAGEKSSRTPASKSKTKVGAGGPADRGTAIVCDQRDSSSVDAAIAKAVQDMGGLDRLVNCAGIVMAGKLAVTSDDLWRSVLEINLFGQFYFCRAVMPHLMKEPGSTIVNISSGAALLPASDLVSCSASKAGIPGMTRSERQVASTLPSSPTASTAQYPRA